LKKIVKIGIIITIVSVAIVPGIYTLSPLFTSKTVDEPLPGLNSEIKENMDFSKFMNLTEYERTRIAKNMTSQQIDNIMVMAAKYNSTVTEDMTGMDSSSLKNTLTGSFAGAGDGFHDVSGMVKIFTFADGKSILRLEDFKSTNGPDVYVYLSTDKKASDSVNVGRLKGNIGNQNYEIPQDVDLSKYNMVLIWCRAFSVLFGSAELQL
jgi:hypothetical protein